MTPEQREQLADRLSPIDAAMSHLAVAVQPFLDALDLMEAARQAIMDEFGAVEVDNCEGCGRMLCEGDNAFSYEDGPRLCEEHAPNIADVIRENREALERDDMDEEDRELTLASIANLEERLEAGESPDTKVVSAL